MDALLAWWPPLGMALNALIAWALWSMRRAIDQRLEDVLGQVRKRADDHEVRLIRVEADARHAPRHDDLQQIHGRVSDVKTKVYEVGAELRAAHADIGGLRRSVDLLVSHQIKGSAGE